MERPEVRQVDHEDGQPFGEEIEKEKDRGEFLISSKIDWVDKDAEVPQPPDRKRQRKDEQKGEKLALWA